MLELCVDAKGSEYLGLCGDLGAVFRHVWVSIVVYVCWWLLVHF